MSMVTFSFIPLHPIINIFVCEQRVLTQILDHKSKQMNIKKSPGISPGPLLNSEKCLSLSLLAFFSFIGFPSLQAYTSPAHKTST